jgi:hypothetical protein
MTNPRIERASRTDLPFIMATERMDGYDHFVGRWDEARHLSALADGHYAYFPRKRGHGAAWIYDRSGPGVIMAILRPEWTRVSRPS